MEEIKLIETNTMLATAMLSEEEFYQESHMMRNIDG